MATDITDRKTEITTDDDFFWSVNPRFPVVVSIAFSAGAGGAFVIKNSQVKPYRNEGDTADLAIDFNDTITSYQIDPTGGHINFTTTGMVAGSGSALVVVTQQKNAG